MPRRADVLNDSMQSPGGRLADAPAGAGRRASAAVPTAVPTAVPSTAALPGRRLGPLPYLLAFALYQTFSLALWWHLLAGGPGSSIPTGSGDPGEEVWFLAWVPHALGTGANPFFSRALFAPHGVNLLANTSLDVVGLLLAPVTVTAGPVASFAVAALAAPALSALGGFALCRRYVSWAPAAFAGGLCYGFDAFVTTDLRFGHLDLTWLVLPPLILLALDELLVRRRRRPAVAGAVLGGLVVAQFFVSTELLAITALTAAAAVAVAALARPHDVRPALRAAGPGLVVAIGVAVAALAYPLWMVVAGPQHIVGAVWPRIGRIATNLAATVEPHAELGVVHFVSGGNGSYLGVPLLGILLVGALVLWRRSPALRFALALAAISYVASLGYDLHVGRSNLAVPLPAALLGHLPLLDSIVPERFSAMVDLFAGLSLAIVADHVALGLRRTAPARDHPGRVVAALVVATIALVPMWLAAPWPYPVRAVSRPAALRTPALPGPTTAWDHEPPVVLVYPDSPLAISDTMVWQAEARFAFSLPDGYAIVPGPDGHSVQSPPNGLVWTVLAGAAFGRLRLPVQAATAASIRRELDHLGIGEVVVLPGARGSRAVRQVLGQALGAPTRRLAGAALWVRLPARSPAGR